MRGSYSLTGVFLSVAAGGGTHAIVSVKMEGKRATGAESGWLFEGVGSDLCVQKWTPD